MSSERIKEWRYHQPEPAPAPVQSAPPINPREMSIRLPLEQWQTITQLLLAAPYVRAKAPLESIERQAKEFDAEAGRARAVEMQQHEALRQAHEELQRSAAALQQRFDAGNELRGQMFREMGTLHEKIAQLRAQLRKEQGNGAAKPRKRRRRKRESAPVASAVAEVEA